MVGRHPLEVDILGSSPSPATLRDKSVGTGSVARAPTHARSDAKGFSHSTIICLSFKKKFEPMFWTKIRRSESTEPLRANI